MASSSPQIISSISPRTRSRIPVSIGSNQPSKRWELLSVVGCESSGFVVTLVMAWSPARRSNAGRFEVEHPGDYAAFNSYQPSYGTGGQVQVFFDTLPSSIEHIKTGRLRALAVTTEKRAEALPDVPTVSEFVPGYQSSTWWGIVAPKGV